MLKSLNQLIEEARSRGPRRLAVAYGQDSHTLRAVSDAARQGIVTPVIYGDKSVILSVCEEESIDTEGMEIIDIKGDVACVRAAVADVASGKADVLMKGLVSTDKYMRGILDKEAGLFPQGGLLSHVSVFELSGRGKLLCVGDVAVIPQPDFKQKVKITGYLATTARSLGIEIPKVAFIAPSEQVLPQVTSSSEAAVLAKMADRGQLGRIEADGPLSLDVALWPEVAQEKGVKGSRVAGDADCLLFPNIESGNVFFKAATHLAGAEVAAMVVGTRVPCVLTSRGDTPLTKLYSIALACLNA
ncbi:MAG: phosphate acyltransferase [Muribaculaceae bacterium]|nr:phosphate acyltransferase [Muribaculaceae bacterium]